MDQENWILAEVDREDDGSLSLTFYCGSTAFVLNFPPEKLERIIKLYGATEKK